MVKDLKMVKYCNVCDTFKEWLADNEHRFNRKPKIRHYDKGESLRIYFEDVIPEIDCYVNEVGMGIAANFRRRFWDYIEDFDFFIKRNRNRKYFCGLCREPKLYNTPQDLLIDHSFENFLEWVNNHFTPFHVLELLQCQRMTSARIIDIREPDSRHASDREAFQDFLSKLRKVGPGSPPAFKNLDNMKITFIPVLKEKEQTS